MDMSNSKCKVHYTAVTGPAHLKGGSTGVGKVAIIGIILTASIVVSGCISSVKT